ncbi:DUF6173 family protein [Rhodalgimonas zhirmunskyi]|uniref:DUF6173 family protein n=1 Tax=Rhodalgimonas zhirmunskyi TaxID=2964767 RepID=A0AAJ1UCV7_9RHOB|nr:DUF6173 family protein [Rhodoalgimonas zhirmunskyi]MDQ2093552.1 DUF6173 family protein [Rhodoalgimonas zhirmunskyi]
MDDKIETTAEAHERAAMPRRREVHAEPGTADCSDIPEEMTQTPMAEKSPAEWAYERLILYIQNFEEQLDNNQEIAVGFAGGEAGVIRIEGIGFFDPDIVTFYGSDESGLKTQLIQHVTQLSVVLRALPALSAPEEAPKRIGFRLAQAFDRDAKKDAAKDASKS